MKKLYPVPCIEVSLKLNNYNIYFLKLNANIFIKIQQQQNTNNNKLKINIDKNILYKLLRIDEKSYSKEILEMNTNDLQKIKRHCD